MRTLLSFLIVSASLAGCGFKGPLYLPTRGAQAAKPVAPASTPTVDEQRPVPSDAAPAPK